MFRAFRGLLFFTNLLTFVASLPLLILGLVIGALGHTRCISFIQGPMLVIATLLFVVSLLGMIGSCCRATFMLWLYQCLMLLFIAWLLLFTVLAAMEVQKNGHEGDAVEASQLPQFSDWLKINIADKDDWAAIKTCLSAIDICADQGRPGEPASVEINGCCKPPTSCGYELKNGTTWIVPKSGLASKDGDCKSWSNDPNTMCYDCNSCKAGFLSIEKSELRKLNVFSSCLIAFLIINFMIGCGTFRRSRAVDQYPKQGDYS